MTHYVMGALLALNAVAVVPASAQAGIPSDTVPSSELQAVFGVQTDGTQTIATVDLERVTVVNGRTQMDQVDLSADELVTFSIGQSSVSYSTSEATALPYVAGGTYTVNFKRANGESYASSASLPGLAVFSAPAANAVFNKSEAVTVSWNSVSADEGIFEFSTDCDSSFSGPTYNSAWDEAQFPAGWSANCPNTVHSAIQTIYANVGNGYGSFAAITTSILNFSYSSSTSAFTSGEIPARSSHLAPLLFKALSNHKHALRRRAAAK